MENLRSVYGVHLSGRPVSALQQHEIQTTPHWSQFTGDTEAALTAFSQEPDQPSCEHPHASPAHSQWTDECRDPPLQTQPARMEHLQHLDGENTSVRHTDPHQNLPKMIKYVPVFTDINSSFHRPYVMPHLNPLWPVLVPHVISNASVHQNPFCPVYLPLPMPAPALTPHLTAFLPPVDPACSCHAFQPHMSVQLHPNLQRPASGPPRHRSSGDARTAGKGCAESLVPDLPERALREYAQVMDALAPEEDVCVLYLNQLCKPAQISPECGFDMDSISSLLSSDPITDVLKEMSQDTFSSVVHEPVAGCSEWTPATVCETPIQSSSAVRCDLTRLLSAEERMAASAVWSQDAGQGVFHTSADLPEPLLANPDSQSSETHLNASVPDTILPAPQHFTPKNTSRQEDEASFVVELHPADQSNKSSLSQEPPPMAADAGVEQDGQDNNGQERAEEWQHVSSHNSYKTIPNHSQKTNMPETDKNINKNKTYKTHRSRRRHQKIPTADDRDERNRKAHGKSRKTQKVPEEEEQ